MGKFDRAGEITEQLNRRRTHKAAKLTTDLTSEDHRKRKAQTTEIGV